MYILQFVDAGVPHVIAIKNDAKVSDAASIKFMKIFYSTIFGSKVCRGIQT